MSARPPGLLGAAAGLAFLLPGRVFSLGLDGAFGAAVAAGGLIVLWTQPAPWETRRAARRAASFFAVLQLLALVSYAYSAAFNGLQTGWADWLALARPALLGALTVFVLRRCDAGVRDAMEAALTAAVYVSWAYRPASEHGFVCVLALCWLLFFSRTRLRLLHSAAAVVALHLGGDLPSLTAGLLVVAAAAAVEVHAELSRRRSPRALLLSAALFGALAGGALAVSGPAVPPASTAAARAYARRSPVFGWGPARYEAVPEGGSQFLAWAVRGGGLGAGFILLGLLAAAWSLLKASSGRARRLAGAATFLGAVLLALLRAPHFESDRLYLAAALLAASIAREGGS